jgi:hypothetical protein
VIAALGGLALLAALGVPNAAAETSDAHTHFYDARGLDSCNAPTHSQMAAFWHQTPWWWWAVYIGGVNRACPNVNLTSDWVERELQRGWGLQPIWVGRQAPCASQSGLAHMSRHRNQAYRQGRRAAARAYDRVRSLKMNPRTPIVFDMEAFDTTKRWCRRAVKHYVRGWSFQLRNKSPAVPGYYGSTCASAVSAMWQIAPRPSYVWGANYGSGPDSFEMSCVGSDIWPQRLKQYTGGTSVTENGVTLTVDKDCAHGPMYAVRYHDRGDCS